MAEPKFAPGFRISFTDLLVLIGGATAAGLLWQINAGLAVLPALPVLHFFLFCNVFRIERKKELIWAASCIISSLAAMQTDYLTSPLFIGYNFFLAAILIVIETRSPEYHGIFWKQFNPDLENHWHRKNSKIS
ncbi:MAG TPA: hypothetical protein PLM07_08395 [Candidatus Rifleibacterium sp.]|nr:hypothetical protein [Candidatus Rifleibacterium sp.]HPT45904.1 hypothetical protein [Candidatus Rifleibacterium sp.]